MTKAFKQGLITLASVATNETVKEFTLTVLVQDTSDSKGGLPIILLSVLNVPTSTVTMPNGF